MKIYPNPLQDVFYIDLSGPNSTLTLSDESGKKILTKKCGKTVTLDLSKNPVGIYYLLIKNASKTATLKVLKIKK